MNTLGDVFEKNEQQAFPCVAYDVDEEAVIIPGMTLRDYFAGQALSSADITLNSAVSAAIAKKCYAIADAMIKARDEHA